MPRLMTHVGGALLAVCLAPVAMVLHAAEQQAISAITKKPAFACKTRELIANTHAALGEALSSDAARRRFESVFQSQDCWGLKPDTSVLIVTDGDWGSPIEIVYEGSRGWVMQHMVRYTAQREHENDLIKFFHTSGFAMQCNWGPKLVIVDRVVRIGNVYIEKFKIDNDRVFFLQDKYFKEGMAFAREKGCDHIAVKIIEKEFKPFFSGQSR